MTPSAVRASILLARNDHPFHGTETYPSTAKVWQTLNIDKSSRIPNNLIISGAVHGQISEHCSGVICQTLLFRIWVLILGVSPDVSQAMHALATTIHVT